MATVAKPLPVGGTKGFSIPYNLGRYIRTFLLYAVLLTLSMFFLFPLVWMVGTSLKTIDEVQQPQFNLLPAAPQWENYVKLFQDEAFIRAYLNSLFITPMVLAGTVSSIAFVAFAFSRLQWKGRGVVFALMMGTLMLPYQATLVPQYVLFYNLGWLRTYNPITLPGFFAGGAALIFLLRQFMMGIPRELDEAAMMDGANPLQIWWLIIMPLSLPALATVTVLLTIGSWNNLIQPLIYLQRAELLTLPIYIAQKLTNEVSPLPWQDAMAASVLFVTPILVIFLLTQRYFVEGIAFTGSKEG
jgi:multiple sugar transport system permease protein